MFKFNRNYNNKLECSSFTTVRLNDRHEIGDKVDIYLTSEYLGKVVVVNKSKFRLSDISENFFLDILIRLDCGSRTINEFIGVMEECYSKEALLPYITGEKEFVLYYLSYIK